MAVSNNAVPSGGSLVENLMNSPYYSQIIDTANQIQQQNSSVSDTRDLIKLYSQLEETSAQKAHERALELQNNANTFTAVENMKARLFNLSSAQSAMDFNAEQARLDREFQQSSADKAMQFNASEAEKNRTWQENLTNTAYQRAVNDLKAAGLNPILAYTQGGASSTGGSSASAVSASGSRASASAASTSGGSGAMTSAVKSNVASVIGSVLSQNASYMNNLTQSVISDADRKASNYNKAEDRRMYYYLGNVNAATNLFGSMARFLMLA